MQTNEPHPVISVDHDGTASTDWDEKKKASPQVLAIIGEAATRRELSDI